MAVCKYCKNEMLDGKTCVPKIKIGGNVYDRIPFKIDKYHNTTCGDCGVKIGQIHHFHCDMERCPICGGQMLMHILSGYRCVKGGDIEALLDKNDNVVCDLTEEE